MKKINLERSLRGAINQAPTVDFEKLASMPVVKMTGHDYITMQHENRKANTFRGFSVAVSFCLILLVCFSGWFTQYRLPDSVIAIDVNPSIEIVTNKQNHILSVNALNEDAQVIIGEQDYRNAELSDTVDALLISLINHGYLSADKNIIMISVENKNIDKAEKLAILLDKKIQKSASTQNITPDVLRQIFTKDKEASAAAAQYSISVGKMKLIQEIISSNSKLSIDELAHMSMEGLLAVSRKYAIDLDKIIQYNDDSNIDEGADIQLNTNQNANNSSKPANDQNENDSSQPDDDQNGNDSSKPANDQNENDSAQTIINQNENVSSPTDADTTENDAADSDSDSDSTSDENPNE